jgi:hypothetical protein
MCIKLLDMLLVGVEILPPQLQEVIRQPAVAVEEWLLALLMLFLVRLFP